MCRDKQIAVQTKDGMFKVCSIDSEHIRYMADGIKTSDKMKHDMILNKFEYKYRLINSHPLPHKLWFHQSIGNFESNCEYIFD